MIATTEPPSTTLNPTPNDKINPPSQADRIQFWKHAYARASFVQSQVFIELLLRENPDFNTTLRRALTVAIVTTYCRPFKQRKPVRLSDEIVPSKYQEIHNKAIELRDKVIAHRDIDGPTADWGFVSQLRVTVGQTGVTFDTLSPNIDNDMATNLKPLIKELVVMMDTEMTPFLKKFNPLPPPATYVISLEETPTEWLIPISRVRIA